MISLLLLFLSVVIASAICSMSEAALLSLSFVRARILVEEKRKNAKELLYLKENLPFTVAAIVMINNAVNIVGSIFVGQRVVQLLGNEWLAVASTLLTIVIIIWAEVIPKTLGQRYKVPISLLMAKPLHYLTWSLRPFIKMIFLLTQPLTKGRTLSKVSEEEIRMMLKLGRDAGTVEMNEEVLCNRVFKLNDVRAIQIMKPIDQIFSLPAHKTLAEVKEEIIRSPYSRIAVYDKDPIDIVGMVQQRELLREMAGGNDKSQVREFMTAPIFVNWYTKADALLEKFQAYNQHLFIVQDADGRNVGVVTMEDVLEELFGEIYDEKDVFHKRFALSKAEQVDQSKRLA